MRQYLLKRILIFIPFLFVISLVAFFISLNAPGDPAERLISGSQTGDASNRFYNQLEQRRFWIKKLGLNLPVFYFSLHSLAEPDSLYKIEFKSEKKALARLINQYGNWNAISKYYKSIKQSESNLVSFYSSSNEYSEIVLQSRFDLTALASLYDERIIISKLTALRAKLSFNPVLASSIDLIRENFETVIQNKTNWKNYIPCLSFHLNNQYHRWLFGDGIYSRGILRGDFGISYVTKEPVSKIIVSRIKWSLFFSVVSIVLAYLISIPLGAKAAAKRNSAFDKYSSLLLFTLYSLPVFWLATLLMMTFANPDFFKLFPASGVMPIGGYPPDAGLLMKIRLSLPYLILPTICYTYSSIAFLSRTMRVSMLEQLNEDYIRTARAKGLSENKVVYVHALRNSLLPIITLLANIFPAMIGGSVILETIFTIPGMGYETVFAVQNQNHPMIIAIFTITGLLTMIGYLVADILYAIADPRISYH